MWLRRCRWPEGDRGGSGLHGFGCDQPNSNLGNRLLIRFFIKNRWPWLGDREFLTGQQVWQLHHVPMAQDLAETIGPIKFHDFPIGIHQQGHLSALL